jgi:hypothetical protein
MPLTSGLGNLFTSTVDYSRFFEYSRRGESDFAHQMLLERTKRTPNESTIDRARQLESRLQESSLPTEKLLPIQSNTTNAPVNLGASVDQLVALLTEVDVRNQAPLNASNTESSQSFSLVLNSLQSQQQDFVDFNGTGAYINFTADDADANGDGIVTSTEQLLYDSMHLFVKTKINT